MPHEHGNRPHFGKSMKEAAVIVFSILVAFTLDAWWERLGVDRDIQEVLQAIRVEVNSNVVNLEGSISHHEDIRAAIGKALQSMSSEEIHGEAVIDVEVFEPNTGALDTLVSAGLLGNIEDGDLRVLLGSFAGAGGDLRERELRTVMFRDAARERIAAIGIPIWDSARQDRSPLYQDIEMLNLLTMRNAEERDSIESARRLLSHLSRISSRLDAVL